MLTLRPGCTVNSFAADEFRLRLGLMKMMWNRPHIVEKLRVDRPATVGIPNRLSEHVGPHFCNRGLKRHFLPPGMNVAEPFIVLAIFVRRRRGRSEPPFINSATVQAVGIQVVGVKL